MELWFMLPFVYVSLSFLIIRNPQTTGLFGFPNRLWLFCKHCKICSNQFLLSTFLLLKQITNQSSRSARLSLFSSKYRFPDFFTANVFFLSPITRFVITDKADVYTWTIPRFLPPDSSHSIHHSKRVSNGNRRRCWRWSLPVGDFKNIFLLLRV